MLKTISLIFFILLMSKIVAQENLIQYRLYLHDQDTISQRDFYVERSLAKIDRIVERLSRRLNLPMQYCIWYDAENTYQCFIPERKKKR